jgi:hypothetical protein
MGVAAQLVTGFFTAAGAGTGLAVANGGDTFAVQNFASPDTAFIDEVWANGATTDFVRVRSPRLHDANQGIRLRTAGILGVPLIPYDTNNLIYPADVLTVEIDATGAGTGAISIINYYNNIPGVAARLATWAEVGPRVDQISGVDVALGAIPAIGSYSPGNAINSLFDNFQAGSDYALLGYLTAANRLTIAIQGQDTGNLKIGGPGIADARTTSDYFIRMSNRSGLPYIPIIAANNKGSTNVFQADNAASAATNVTLIMAELH